MRVAQKIVMRNVPGIGAGVGEHQYVVAAHRFDRGIERQHVEWVAVALRIGRAKVMRAAAADGFLNATDLAEYLVTKGVPFREAHETVGRIVRECLESGQRLEVVPLQRLRHFSRAFEADVSKYITLEACIERRRSAGGTKPQGSKASRSRICGSTAGRCLRRKSTNLRKTSALRG